MSEAKKTKKQSAKKYQKTIVKKPLIQDPNARVRKKPFYQNFRLHKRVKHPAGPLPSSLTIARKALLLLQANARNITRFSIVYGFLYLLFVRGFSSPIDIDQVRESFAGAIDQNVSTLATNFTVFGLMVQSTTSAAGDLAGLYQMFFLVLSTLALIWLFRQQQAGNKVTMKDAFYRGMFPLVPFLLLIVVIALQTLPASMGSYLFNTVLSDGIAVGSTEQIAWFLFFMLTILLSLYLMSGSLIALFIVTLPEMTPINALRKAKELVNYRRASIIRKVVALILLVLIAFISIVFPVIFISATFAQLLFVVLTILLIPFAVAYLFVLYRELL